MTKEDLYDLLSNCLPSQLTAITVMLNLNEAYLPSSIETPAARAAAILKLAEQKFGSLTLPEQAYNWVIGSPIAKPLPSGSPSVTEKQPLSINESNSVSSIKVFISYAHSSPQHQQAIYNLADTLRLAGISVLMDTDVKTPQGPPEGWPKWMKSQIKKANWVLLVFDDVYRRRFDGMEPPDKGHGATWETHIIANELYLAQTKNTRFIPLLADDGDQNLIPLELSSATVYRIPSQSKELSLCLSESMAK